MSLRRYGIEVDKIEDVGTTIINEFGLPVKMMETEERNSLPKDVRDKMNKKGREYWDRLFSDPKLVRANVKKAVMRQLERGFPISYGEDNKVFRRYPDGRIFEVSMDLKTFERSETFVRMATPEDDTKYD